VVDIGLELPQGESAEVEFQPVGFRFGGLKNIDIDMTALEGLDTVQDQECSEHLLPPTDIDYEIIQSELCNYIDRDAQRGNRRDNDVLCSLSHPRV